VKDNVLTIPNALCLARIGSIPIIGYWVIGENYAAACVLFAFAGVTDMLDGMIARKFPSQKSILGSVLDPVADKFLISTLFVTLSYTGLIPIWLTSLVLGRDILLIAGGLVRRYQLLKPPVTVKRFFDPSVSSVRVQASWISKVNTALQLSLVTLSLASPLLGFQHHPFLTGLGYATAATTLWSGGQYAWSRGEAMMPVKRFERLQQRIKSWKSSRRMGSSGSMGDSSPPRG